MSFLAAALHETLITGSYTVGLKVVAAAAVALAIPRSPCHSQRVTRHRRRSTGQSQR